MNKPFENLLNLVPKQEEKQEKKSSRGKAVYVTDPEAFDIMEKFIAFCGNNRKAADALSIDKGSMNLWAKRKGVVRKCYSDLAKFIMKEAEQKTLTADHHTAIVTVKNQYKDEMRKAIEAIGGQYTLLTYTVKE